MKAKNTIKESRTDWNRLKAMADQEIDASDIPVLGRHFFDRAHIRIPGNGKAVFLQLDPDVLDWFKREEDQYQAKINAVLRAYVEAHQR